MSKCITPKLGQETRTRDKGFQGKVRPPWLVIRFRLFPWLCMHGYIPYNDPTTARHTHTSKTVVGRGPSFICVLKEKISGNQWPSSSLSPTLYNLRALFTFPVYLRNQVLPEEYHDVRVISTHNEIRVSIPIQVLPTGKTKTKRTHRVLDGGTTNDLGQGQRKRSLLHKNLSAFTSRKWWIN